MSTKILPHNHLSFFLLLAFSLAFVGCGGDDNPTTPAVPVVPDTLVDTWILSEISLDGQLVDPGDAFGWPAAICEARLVLHADGRYRMEGCDDQGAVLAYQAGSVTLTGNDFGIWLNDDDGATQAPELVFSGVYALVDDDLILTGDADGIAMDVVLVRD